MIRGDNGGFEHLPACEIGSADLPCVYTVGPDDYQNGVILYNYKRLAVLFYGREVDEQGNHVGGPMYYMKNKLNAKWLAVIFAVATIISSFGTPGRISSGNTVQFS